MSQSVIAVYPGTFDPMTLGHQDLIRRAAGLFGTVIVAVAVAHHKKTLFSLEERLDSVREVMRAYPNVRVEPFSGLVVEFATRHGARAMLRGVRSVTDFDFESQLAGMNRAMVPDVESVFDTGRALPTHLKHLGARDCHAQRRRGPVCVACRACAPVTKI